MSQTAVRSRRWAWLLIPVMLLGVRVYRPAQEVALGRSIRYDDFLYTVRGVESVPATGGERTGEGLLVVTLELENQARRVPFRFGPATAILVDARGTEYRSVHDPRAEEGRDPTRSPFIPPLKPGERATVELVFPVPGDLKRPRLRFTAGPLGDFLEGMIFGAKQFQLDESRG